jgi:hypothetical protein
MLCLRQWIVSLVFILGGFRSKQNFSPSPRRLVRLGGGWRVTQRLWYNLLVEVGCSGCFNKCSVTVLP